MEQGRRLRWRMNYLLSTTEHWVMVGSESLRPHLSSVVMTWSVTLLAIFGDDINSRFKRLVIARPFPIRVVAFVLLVASGYGAASLLISHYLASVLMLLDSHYLGAVIIVAFVLLGILAEHKGHI
jgi:hypothetical protein